MRFSAFSEESGLWKVAEAPKLTGGLSVRTASCNKVTKGHTRTEKHLGYLTIWVPIWRSASCCTKKLCWRPSSPFAGTWNSFLHVGHDTSSPGLLSLKHSWRHLRQKAWRQGSDFGLSNCSKQIGQVVRSVVTVDAVAMILFLYFSTNSTSTNKKVSYNK